MYTLLIGPAGFGKGTASGPIEDMLREIGPDFYFAPSSVSKASLFDTLNDAKRKLVKPANIPPVIEYNSLYVLAREFGHFLPTYDNEFMMGLTDVYDGKIYEERKRGRELKFKITQPTLNLLGGTTPHYLMNVFPEGAWEQGFASRTVMIFSAKEITNDPLPDEDEAGAEALEKDMLHDLKYIHSEIYGEMVWSPAARQLMRLWVKGDEAKEIPPTGLATRPDHPRLVGYRSRRNVHFAKLCMVASISRGNDLCIRVEDYQLALDWLIEAEFYMADMFKSMVVGVDAKAAEEAYHHIHKLYMTAKMQKLIPANVLIRFLAERVPHHSVLRIVEIMEKSKMIEAAAEVKGVKMYKPVSKGGNIG